MAKGEKGRRRPWREKSRPEGKAADGASKESKKKQSTDEVVDLHDLSDISDEEDFKGNGDIKADVAQFAANLGLNVDGFSGSGFDDRDFRRPPKKADGPKEAKADGKGEKRQKEKAARKPKKERERAPETERTESAFAPSEVAPSENVPSESFFNAGGGGIEDVQMGPWYEQASSLADKSLPAPAESVEQPKKKKHSKAKDPPPAPTKPWSNHDELVQQMKVGGEGLMQKAAEAYERGQGKSGKDVQWLVRARKGGTSADKVAAMTVMLQEDPPANVRSLDALLGMVSNKGGKRNAAIAIDALRELFVTSLLPDRKLKYLTQQPQLEALAVQGKEGEPLLRFWYWEDALKQRYDTFVSSLDALSRDALAFLKEKAMKTVYDLLVARPEQEAKLLASLVNKLGDPERKVASKAGYLLARLLEQHPNMKRVVVQEIEAFVFRPHVGLRARYYAVVFLNQILLHKKGEGPAVAKSLIGLYFGLFKALTSLEADNEAPALNNFKKSLGKRPRQKTREVKKIIQSKKKRAVAKGAVSEDSTVGVDSRILSAILTGVNRAFPYVAADDIDALLKEHTPELFRMVHAGNFNVSVQALLLLHQLMSSHQAVSERFYRALYATLLSPALAKSSKAALFLSVLFKAMKADLDSKRIAAFAKRLLQIATHQSANFACGSLLLVSEVLKLRPILWGAIQQPEDKGDDLEHFEDVQEEEENDADDPKPAAEAERAEAQASQPSDPAANDQISPVLGFSADDDVSDEDEGSPESSGESGDDSDAEESRTRSTNASTSEKKEKAERDKFEVDRWPAKGRYDARSREPSFCNAETACWWEVTTLAAHAHPSVAAMAKTLLAGANVLYDGDPLRDLALSIFLDRFIEKKPRAFKADGKFKGGSFMQPLKGARSHLLVGSEAFAALEQNQVPTEDAFFHKFYTAKAAKKPGRKRNGAESSDEDSDEEAPSKKNKTKKKKKRSEADEDIEEVGSDDDALERILQRGLNEEEGSAEEGGSDEEPDEGGWDYNTLAKVLEKDDERDARSDDEESLEGGASDEDDEVFMEGFAEAGSDDDEEADVSGEEGDDIEEEDDEMEEDDDDIEEDDDDIEEEGLGSAGFDEDTSENEDEISEAVGKKRKGRGAEVPDTREDHSDAMNGLRGKRKRRGQKDEVEMQRGDESKSSKKKRKQTEASPFASAEEYAHLLD